MKRLIIAIVSLAMFFGTTLPARAGDGAAAGALIGAGSGVLIGRAVGHDANAALAGGIIGGMFGLVIGSEYDRQERQVVYTPSHYRVRPRHDGWHATTVITIVNGRRYPVRVEAYRSGYDWILWGDFHGRGRERLIIENHRHLPPEIIILDRGHAWRDHWPRDRFVDHRHRDRHEDRYYDRRNRGRGRH